MLLASLENVRGCRHGVGELHLVQGHRPLLDQAAGLRVGLGEPHTGHQGDDGGDGARVDGVRLDVAGQLVFAEAAGELLGGLRARAFAVVGVDDGGSEAGLLFARMRLGVEGRLADQRRSEQREPLVHELIRDRHRLAEHVVG